MATTTKTKADMVERVLRNLGVLPQGQTASGEDKASIDALIDVTYASLAERGVINVPNADAVPLAWFMPLSFCVTLMAAPEFGAIDDPAIAAKATRAEIDLVAMQCRPPTYAVQEGEYM